jgi:tRNA pseudouridine32 synthase/23S rRNA pseudouridine746 synthase
MQFERREVEKRYIAVVEGRVGAECGEVDAPMRADVDNRPVQVIDQERGRPSMTKWRLLALEPDRSRLELVPLTGRTHQLRVHMAHIGHPIVGDVLYGPRREAVGADRLLLHAAMLRLREPGGGPVMEFVAPMPF